MLIWANLALGEDEMQLSQESGFREIKQETKLDASDKIGPLSRLLKPYQKSVSDDKVKQFKPNSKLKPIEESPHQISHHPTLDNDITDIYSTPNLGRSKILLQEQNFDYSFNTDAQSPEVVHDQAVIEDSFNWLKDVLVATFPLLLVVLAAMLTFFMVQFCLKKKSLIKSGKKKFNQSKKSSQTIQSQVPIVRCTGESKSPAAQSWARKSISGSRQCAIDIEESSNDSEASASSADEKTKRLPKSLGSIKYRMTYDFARSVFAVTVLEAKDLPGMDLCGFSDPYVKVYFVPDEARPIQKTKVKKRNLNPVFDETFEFNISYPQLVSKSLVLAVYDYDRFSRHDEIGLISLPMNTVELAETIERWQSLERLSGSKDKEKLGDLCLGLRYVPNSGKLTVIVMEARGLKKMDLAGLSDPFVKVALYIGGKRVKKKKTEIKKCTLNPQFNESFSFEVSSEQMQTAQLRFTVIDYDRIGVSEPIGGIVLACTEASGETESRHWMDMLASPRRQISRWHSLHPHLI